jgi:hypothetical protein
MKITKKFLLSLWACEEHIDLFCRVFPDGCEVTPENAQKACDEGLDLGWLLSASALPLTGTFTYPNGDRHWYQDGRRHRTDGPSIECDNGNRYWHQNDRLHRTDGPAIEYWHGSKSWYQNGLRHRTDGPALETANGHKEWYLNGVRVR